MSPQLQRFLLPDDHITPVPLIDREPVRSERATFQHELGFAAISLASWNAEEGSSQVNSIPQGVYPHQYRVATLEGIAEWWDQKYSLSDLLLPPKDLSDKCPDFFPVSGAVINAFDTIEQRMLTDEDARLAIAVSPGKEEEGHRPDLHMVYVYRQNPLEPEHRAFDPERIVGTALEFRGNLHELEHFVNRLNTLLHVTPNAEPTTPFFGPDDRKLTHTDLIDAVSGAYDDASPHNNGSSRRANPIIAEYLDRIRSTLLSTTPVSILQNLYQDAQWIYSNMVEQIKPVLAARQGDSPQQQQAEIAAKVSVLTSLFSKQARVKIFKNLAQRSSKS